MKFQEGVHLLAHGLARNRHDGDVFCQAGLDDGLTNRRVTVEEYFAEFLGARS